MKKDLCFLKTVLPISTKLKKLLSSKINQYTESNPPAEHYTLNFKDTSYDAESGGFRPIEISISKYSDVDWNIDYITEFAYFGHYYPELERSIDFDIINQSWFIPNKGFMPLETTINDAKSLYLLWESNFIEYVKIDCYDKITVTQ